MKIRIFENGKLKNYDVCSMSELIELTDELKREWRNMNRTDDILAKGLRDESYEEYCKDINHLIIYFQKQEDEEIERAKRIFGVEG